VAKVPDSARDLIESGALGHLVTMNEDGSPQVSCVWVGMDGDEIVSGHLPHNRKVQNVERDPRVVLSLEGSEKTSLGLQHYLLIHGKARVTEGGAQELLERLGHAYLGPDVTFRPMPDPPPGYIIHIEVERIGGVGPWAS
jgi:PPOX class probable F420-dependent enzyme